MKNSISKQERRRIDQAKEKFMNPTKASLENLRSYYVPGGSGPLSMMANICALIELLAEAKGIELD